MLSPPTLLRLGLALLALMVPATTLAHGFGRLYNLPVPFWLYGWGASATLAVSFLLVAFFAAAPDAATPAAGRDLTGSAWVRGLRRALPWLRRASVFLLLLCMATALVGTRDAYRNFGMTFFWIVFVLFITYLSALLGDFYGALNPWRALGDGIARYWRGFTRGRLSYPPAWGDWPALILFLGFIWLELFGTGRPVSLGLMLLGYTALNLCGIWLIGSRAWFRHGEFFSLFLRLIALMAPLHYRRAEAPGERSSLHLRWPFAGLIRERPYSLATVLFVLAMLSTTAFDGLRQTQWWVRLFWADPTGLVTALAGNRPIMVFPMLRPWYIGWETLWLLASPFLYFAAYIGCIALARMLTRSQRSVRELALDFGYSLLPIALVYHATHYSTLLLTQGLKIVSLLSDPFGWDWNLFGTAHLLRAPILPEMGTVWHTQVGLILFGHIVSVYVAHRIALRIWPTRGQALLSQLPMLGLMIAFTVAGLWILAQPLTAMTLR